MMTSSYLPINASSFNYDRAFSRNLGWIGQEELNKLRRSTVAIAGMGGVGGSHLITLVRLGVGSFHIADFDQFDIENFNRQYGASMTSVGKKKIEVMKQLALDINPELKIREFPDGVNSENMSSFLEGVDVYLDGLDIFAMDVRQQIFKQCYNRQIPAVTVGPIATGASLMTFMPGKMSFDDYFDFRNLSLDLKVMTFIVGMTPSFMQAKYLVDKKYFNVAEKKAPSTPMGCMMASGIAAAEIMKIILERGSVRVAPWSLHFDPYLQSYKCKYTIGGRWNPWYRLKVFIAKKLYAKQTT
jgi:molybdopterin/thiamine biosynthesis adenylyltransferase